MGVTAGSQAMYCCGQDLEQNRNYQPEKGPPKIINQFIFYFDSCAWQSRGYIVFVFPHKQTNRGSNRPSSPASLLFCFCQWSLDLARAFVPTSVSYQRRAA